MITQKLNDKLQTFAHDGHAQVKVEVKIGNQMFDIKDVVIEDGNVVIVTEKVI
jgi:hypothetical protein